MLIISKFEINKQPYWMLQVKKICKQQGISYKELANRMGVPAETISRILSRGGNPTLTTLVSIADALGVEVYELFQGFNEKISVRGYIEVGDTLHRINNFTDLQTVYYKLKDDNGEI